MATSATSDVQIDNDEVRVTEWRLAPGSATGHHRHGMDYVIVPVTWRAATSTPAVVATRLAAVVRQWAPHLVVA